MSVLDKGDWWGRMAIGSCVGLGLARVGRIIGHGIEPVPFLIGLVACLAWCLYCAFRAVSLP